eukprot:scaffold2.g7525.t1
MAEERRRQRELQEARKAGLAAPELDEEGKPINPHVPQFMAAAPWYLNADKPSLKHQKNWKDGVQDDRAWYDRGVKVFQATKFRKGACENCGSMAHKTKDCMERPRSKGARWTGKGIAADEKVEDIHLATFDAKRDRWNGYNPDEWVKYAERFERVQQMRQEVRKAELAEKAAAGEVDEEAAADELEADELKVAETEEAGFGKVEKRVRTVGGGSSGTVRNLRIREDTAKYLLNLDVNSAYYDPKSRSMREDPNPEKSASQKMFAGDNFARQTGEVSGFKSLNLFSVTSYEKGHAATPSQAETAFQEFKKRKEVLSGQTKEAILEKYGSAAAAPSDDVRALQASEAYVEYDAAGRVVKGQEVKARSRYEEDVLVNNHTAVWGSWWSDGAWGYACCHSTVKNSYCTGRTGEGAAVEAAEALAANLESKAAERAAEAAAAAEGKPRLEGAKPTAGLWGSEVEEGLQLDPAKLAEALKRQRRREAAAEEEGQADDRKRRYNSLAADDAGVSAEDMEAYRMTKERGDDPLAAIKRAKAAAAGGGDGYDFV